MSNNLIHTFILLLDTLTSTQWLNFHLLIHKLRGEINTSVFTVDKEIRKITEKNI